MINIDLEKQITEQVELIVKSYLDSDDLKKHLSEQIDNAVGGVIQRVATKVYTDIMNENQLNEHIDSIVKVEARDTIKTLSTRRVQDEIAKVSVRDLIEKQVQKDISIKVEKCDFPEASIPVESIKWAKGCLNGSLIDDGLISNFSSTGIDDKSNNVQLTILDDHVVVENNFTAYNITAAEAINTKDLSLTGALEIGTEIIDHGALTQFVQTHFEIKIEEALETYKPLFKDGTLVINENRILPTVVESNLKKVGNLQELTVLGDANLSGTVYINANGKVGINTDSPRGSLSVYDQDAEVSFVRSGRRTMFIGSTTPTGIEFGTNSKAQMTFHENHIDINSAINLMGLKFSVSTSVPEHVGIVNEIVFVSTAGPGQPLLYICKGGSKWASLFKMQ